MNPPSLLTIRKLLAAQDPGGYTLPPAVLTAARAVDGLEGIDPEPPTAPDDAGAAAELVAAAAAGQPINLDFAVRPLLEAKREASEHAAARRLLIAANERASQQLVQAVSDLAEQIIGETLAPAYADVLAEAERHATALSGYAHDLSVDALLSAPQKVIKSYQALKALEDRRQQLRTAREWVVACSPVRPQHDVAGEFAGVRYPRRIFPGLAPTQPVPRDWGIPTDPVQRLLWHVTTAKPAEPWMPTVAQQDAAWWDTYGEAVERQRQAHYDALAIGGMAPAGVPA